MMLDLDQNQFAHLDVEDESNQDYAGENDEFDDAEDLMANFNIEVEDEGGPCDSGGKRQLRREVSN